VGHSLPGLAGGIPPPPGAFGHADGIGLCVIGGWRLGIYHPGKTASTTGLLARILGAFALINSHSVCILLSVVHQAKSFVDLSFRLHLHISALVFDGDYSLNRPLHAAAEFAGPNCIKLSREIPSHQRMVVAQSSLWRYIALGQGRPTENSANNYMKPKKSGFFERLNISILFFILASVIFWFIATVVSIPRGRALASAYEASADCSPSKLLPNALGQSPGQNSPAAPATPLCVVRSMTVVWKKYDTGRSYHNYEVLLDDAGTRYDVSVDDDSAETWRTLHAKMTVNAQLVQGRVTLIANGAKIAQTKDQPEIYLHELYSRFVIFGVFTVPVVAFFVSMAKRYMKR
jgi:hypothetical protein